MVCINSVNLQIKVETSLIYQYIVQGGYRAVLFDRIQGVKPESAGEGTHFLVPWLQRAVQVCYSPYPIHIR
jgi:hypothetical protein